MNQSTNLNETPRVVNLHRATVMPAEAATDLGAEDDELPGDGEDRRTGFLICVAGAVTTALVALIGYWLQVAQ